MDILKIVGKPLYQWDTGRKLLLTVPEGAKISKVQFSNIYEASSPVVTPHSVEEKMYANIPNILLQNSGRLSVYAIMHTEDGEETLCHYTYRVWPKKKPSDYVYTETEVLSYSLLEGRIRVLEDAGTANSITLKDTETARDYKLEVIDGKLTMTEVTE